MSTTKPFATARSSSCPVPLPVGKCVQPMATNKLPGEVPTPQSDIPYIQTTSNGVLIAR